MIGKRYLPKSLFGRTLLIVVLPTVLIQLVMAYAFFDRHWDSVTRQMSKTLAGDAAFLVSQLKRSSTKAEWHVINDFEHATGLRVALNDGAKFKPGSTSDDFIELRQQLGERIEEPFTIHRLADGDNLEIRILMDDQMLSMQASLKRIESRTTLAFLAWMLGASALFLIIAVLFLRNQIRPIHQLAEAADDFGRGVDTADFRPHGASEVRKAAKAFIVMRERLKRQIRTRTDMLSGISHDLRTPLTRMKLQLAMMPRDDAIRELEDDVVQMEHMIAEYLDFARGEGREIAIKTNLKRLLEETVSDYQRAAHPVALRHMDDAELDLRASSIRRMLTNIIDNALRYGKRAELSLHTSAHYAEIWVDDEGTGIDARDHEEVFKPFFRLETSRNEKTGGVGLGLTIARDIALAHGGQITLATSPSSGLRVIIKLPL
ncbi:MAG: ATP-binding protein [Rickettsiales bacterium]|jgi:two-component system osmolarity sensor histidine kinase EnvZ|nr:ATP-binding protein [Rickettsiales bacterium]